MSTRDSAWRDVRYRDRRYDHGGYVSGGWVRWSTGDEVQERRFPAPELIGWLGSYVDDLNIVYGGRHEAERWSSTLSVGASAGDGCVRHVGVSRPGDGTTYEFASHGASIDSPLPVVDLDVGASCQAPVMDGQGTVRGIRAAARTYLIEVDMPPVDRHLVVTLQFGSDAAHPWPMGLSATLADQGLLLQYSADLWPGTHGG